MAVARDETERKKLQDDKDGWIAQVSHELRTPLTPIKGFLHTLQRREHQLDAADRHRIYEVMLREEQRLENLVNGLLQATSIDQGGLGIIPRASSTGGDLVTDQVDLYRHSEPPRQISLAVDPAVDEVVADAALATSVLANLLSNALKYSPDGTPIEVGDRAGGRRGRHHGQRPRHGRHSQATASASSRSSPGLGDHLTRPQQGVGLGLYIARRSVEQLGGTIWCDERPGGGARFGFSSLPAVRPRHRRPGRPKHEEAGRSRLGDRDAVIVTSLSGVSRVGAASPNVLIVSATSRPSVTWPNTE